VEEWQAESIPIPHSFEGIVPATSKAYGYHFYPHKIKGEGFFVGVVQKNGGNNYTPRKTKKQQSINLRIPESITPFILQPENYIAYANDNNYGIIPQVNSLFIRDLDSALRVLYKGCEIAEINHRKIKLMPALALWQYLDKQSCFHYEADLQTALTFLHKEDIPVISSSADWVLVSYQGIGLGWCKNLGNRYNNYYPKEWRIKMDINKTS
jgi:NOL1/NOP2/fmu family ribosome biogenesis protein